MKKIPKKTSKIRKILRLCLKKQQIILKKDEAIQNFLMTLNEYKHVNLTKLQPQVQDSVENEETQGQKSHLGETCQT